MKTNIINIERKVKEQTLAVATVRSVLKKAGFDIGSWGANGRIRGMSNFRGDIEVKENEFDNNIESEKITNKLIVTTHTRFMNVKVINWSKKINTNDIAKSLKEKGFKIIEIDNARNIIIVDNK